MSQIQPFTIGALRAKGCAEFFGIGESTWWKWVKEGRAPAGIQISPRCTVWPIEVVQGLLKRAAEGDRI